MAFNHLGQLIEYGVIVTIVIGVIIGMSKGFVQIFFSWFSVLLAVIVSMNFTHSLTALVIPSKANNVLVLFLVAILIFAIIHTIITRFAYNVTQVLRSWQLGELDFLLGAVFGAAQMMVLIGLAVYWAMALRWVDMTPYPVSMFCAFWSEKIIFMFGTQFPAFKRLIRY
ncbi:MAG: CvpA family protein [Brevinema sp.]